MHLFFYQGVDPAWLVPVRQREAGRKKPAAVYQYSSPLRENKSPESFFDEK